MPEMFEKLLAERQVAPRRVEAWFTDHPLEEDRIQATRAQIATDQSAIIRTLTTNTQAFNDFKARVRAAAARRSQLEARAEREGCAQRR